MPKPKRQHIFYSNSQPLPDLLLSPASKLTKVKSSRTKQAQSIDISSAITNPPVAANRCQLASAKEAGNFIYLICISMPIFFYANIVIFKHREQRSQTSWLTGTAWIGESHDVAGKAVVEESDSFTLVTIPGSQCQVKRFLWQGRASSLSAPPHHPDTKGYALPHNLYHQRRNTSRMKGHTTPPITAQRTAQNYQLSNNYTRGLHFQEKWDVPSSSQEGFL